MSYESERAAIEGRWAAQWTATASDYEGVAFTVPNPAAGNSWARIRILNGTAVQASTGAPNSNVHRHPGVIVINLFSPSGVGTKAARALGDTAAAIFRNQVFGGVHCLAASVASNGVDGPWLQTTISIPFYRDEFL